MGAIQMATATADRKVAMMPAGRPRSTAATVTAGNSVTYGVLFISSLNRPNRTATPQITASAATAKALAMNQAPLRTRGHGREIDVSRSAKFLSLVAVGYALKSV